MKYYVYEWKNFAEVVTEKRLFDNKDIVLIGEYEVFSQAKKDAQRIMQAKIDKKKSELRRLQVNAIKLGHVKKGDFKSE